MASTMVFDNPPQKQHPKQQYTHVLTCNSDRSHPRGTPGTGCSCPSDVTVWRQCWTCKTRYRPDQTYVTLLQIHCPQCHGHDTEELPGLVEDPPFQPTLVDIPPAPRPIAWIVEWRWRKKTQEILTQTIDKAVLPKNDWNRHSTRNLTTERQAINQCARLRRTFPAKSFRVTPVSWEPADAMSMRSILSISNVSGYQSYPAAAPKIAYPGLVDGGVVSQLTRI